MPKLALPLDKQAHVLAGYAIAATIAPFGLWRALVVAILAGAVKEWIYDRAHPATHDADPLDFAATVAGAAAYVAWRFLLQHFTGA